ncbi:MAG: DUF1329 domain-containing protein [Gammaproteobacteria bacterium]|nr:DUF1329 domain-containing protein [Gammaproteobacteria bacterium]
MFHSFQARPRRAPASVASLLSATALALVLSAGVRAGTFDLDMAQIQETSPAPGTVIGTDNADQFHQILDADLIALIKQGWLTIKVGEPLSFEPHKAYIAATDQYGGQTKLGDAPGVLLDYTAGRPFPVEPSTDDPRAGEKIAWNTRYTFTGDTGSVPEMYWQYRDMRGQNVERELEFEANSMRFMYRHFIDPKPNVPQNPYKIYSALTLKALEPGDVAGTKLLIMYNSDDREDEQGWTYVPLLRRVRRIATTARTDSFLGSDVSVEDFLGYSGRIMDMTWAYKGTTYVLLPMYAHDKVEISSRKARNYDYHFVDFEGHSGCFPKVTWQLRKVYVVEGRPVREDHPLSRRLFYVDAQTSWPIMAKLYDRAGVLWKILLGGISHPDSHMPENRGTGVPMFDSSSAIDLQNKHCTTIQALTLINPPDVNQREFEPSTLEVGAHR